MVKIHIMLLILLLPVYAIAEVNCIPWESQFATEYDLYINKIDIDAQDIFNPEHQDENHRIHRIANALHIQTREQTIKDQLLFESGDALDLRLLEETARNLRANRYIKDASIVPVKICGNDVDIKVSTTDNWTLTPSISYGRSSGVTKSGISIKEENLFGLGKKLSFAYSSDIDRKEHILNYTDPQFQGTRQVLALSAQNNSDGEGYGMSYSLPFYQLNSPRSWGVSLNAKRRIAPLYDNGELSSEIAENIKSLKLSYGWSDGLKDHRVDRLRVGWQYESNEYSGVNGSLPAITSNKLSYPWLGYDIFNDNYIHKYNFRTMGKIEDISLGVHMAGRVGVITEALGSSNNYLYLGAQYTQGFQPSENQLGLLSFNIDNYNGQGILNGSSIDLSGEWFWFQNSRSNYYASVKYNMIDNPLPGQQIVLGGETGLRGYPVRYQTGDKSLVFSAEKHFFFKWYPYRLVQFGAVIFADAGSAWGQGAKQKMIGDAGVGLRLVSTRSTGNSVIHIDLAFPYNAPDKVDRYQLKFTAEKNL